MRTLDRIGAFESDDEVGTVFKQLSHTIEELDLLFTADKK
jgi:hypothetical protein